MKTEQWLTPVEQDIIMSVMWVALEVLQSKTETKRNRLADFLYYLHEHLIASATREELVEILTNLIGNDTMS